jgi:hypothetical protein
LRVHIYGIRQRDPVKRVGKNRFHCSLLGTP